MFPTDASPTGHDDSPPGEPRPNRRAFLAGLGVITASTVTMAACGSSIRAQASDTPSAAGVGSTALSSATTKGGIVARTTSFLVADFPAPCELTPELLEGPFWFESDLVRRDVTEGREGTPLRLGLRVVDPSCEPLVGASVELWHADAGGYYSGYDTDPDVIPSDLSPDPKPRQNETSFLRGVQVTDGDGIVEFHTIIPGWYVLRAPHLHIHIATPDGRAISTQLFLDPTLLTEVYENREPYKARPTPHVTNEHDILLAMLPSESQDIVLRPKVDQEGFAATFTIAVSST